MPASWTSWLSLSALVPAIPALLLALTPLTASAGDRHGSRTSVSIGLGFGSFGYGPGYGYGWHDHYPGYYSPSYGYSYGPTRVYEVYRPDYYAPAYGRPIYQGRPVDQAPSRSPLVSDIQDRLRAEGYYRGTIDGVFGPQSRDAILRYQRDHGLDPNGRIDASLTRALGLR